MDDKHKDTGIDKTSMTVVLTAIAIVVFGGGLVGVIINLVSG